MKRKDLKGGEPADANHSRRHVLVRLLAGAATFALAGCDAVSNSRWGSKLLKSGEAASKTAQRALTPRAAMAQEFTAADLSPTFRSNGTASPNDATYQRLAKNDFRDWTLKIDGLVKHPQALSLAQLRAMHSRTQITRHDCVEGWSAIAEWTGVPLRDVLASAEPAPNARYVVFHCADPMDDDGQRYYESIDWDDAYHPQTILAYELNGKTLPVANGAPVRVRIERQLGYKMAKYVMRIELVEHFKDIGGGNGGYWEDQGYEWYAGI